MAKRGRAKRATESADAAARAHEGQQRRIFRQGGSWVVPVPWWARRAIDRADGGAIYWHDAGHGAVMLTNSPTRATGSAVLISMERELNRLRRENDRLQRKARARPLKVLNEGVNQGVGVGLKLDAAMAYAFDTLDKRLARIEESLPWNWRNRSRARGKPSPSAPPPALDVSAGEAVTPGVEPPGNP